ncbi:hypothetical protein [Streptomyces capitiformicae]|uniref:Uncharacterized protein n=1 Tax=Streptomyces capitiformicae TaxID=2014920 RepID=A0A919GD34_9ACTN|nr:hypothetical protein [Streptomyces capitiformicae]GHH82537.1 hypothetical protein GCM10017771_06950 [Streptomyces capitiformicae]
MGRRTVRWRAAAAVGAALYVTTALSAPATAADAPTPYSYAEDATRVEGSASSTGAVRLAPGKTYRSSIGPGAKLYYRLDLDAVANAYASATAVPAAGATVASSDGVRVSVEDSDGRRCSYETARFGATRSAHPVTALASREIGTDEYMCQAPGAYYLVVQRVGSGTGSASGSPSGSIPEGSSEEWGLELGYVSEPAVKEGGSTSAPEGWNSASPEAVQGDPERRRGGTGFATASPVAQGVWQDETGIKAGETLFYKVPVDWGQQLYATAELGSTTGGDGFVGNALAMSLYNPARGFVDDALVSYGGDQRSADLDPLPPVAYDNRFSPDGEAKGMRFAGWYYLAVHLGTPVAARYGDEPIGLTLRVRVTGQAQDGPGYLGATTPSGVFEVTDEDQEAAENGTTGNTLDDAGDTDGEEDGEAATSDGGEGSGSSTATGDKRLAMTAVAAGGIGTGSLLVLGLLVWTLVARRRAAGAERAARRAGTASRGRHGPSRGR